jgi:hypothetical protein
LLAATTTALGDVVAINRKREASNFSVFRISAGLIPRIGGVT